MRESNGSIERATDNFSRSPVPPDKTVGWLDLAIIVIGIGITLPVFFLGAEFSRNLGVSRALLAFAVSYLFLGLLNCATALVGYRTRLSCHMLLEFPFGVRGAKLINLFIAVTLVGYFAATADLFGRAVQDALASLYGLQVSAVVFTLLGCAVMTLTAIFGFSAIDRLSILSVPLMLLFLFYTVYLAMQQSGWQAIYGPSGTTHQSLGQAVSTLIGSSIMMIVLAPNWMRFARTQRDALLAVSGLALGFPIILICALIPAAATRQSDIMLIMFGLGISLPALFILTFATWTTNTANLYGNSLTLATVFTRSKDWQLTLLAGVAGTLLALLGIMDYFLDYLMLLGICFPPIAGIYLADFFFVNAGRYQIAELRQKKIAYPALVIWLTSSVLGYLSARGIITLTTLPAFDALAAGFVGYLLLKRGKRRLPSPAPH